MSFRKAEQLVSQVLDQYPFTRDDDKELILMVWEEQGLFLTDTQKSVFRQCTPSETIRRTRQKLQAQGDFVATEKVTNKRRKAEVEYRDHFRKANDAYQPVQWLFDENGNAYQKGSE